MSDAMPHDPMTDLAASAHQLHEAYRAYIEAGFTEQQAFQLVCEILRGGLAQGA